MSISQYLVLLKANFSQDYMINVKLKLACNEKNSCGNTACVKFFLRERIFVPFLLSHILHLSFVTDNLDLSGSFLTVFFAFRLNEKKDVVCVCMCFVKSVFLNRCHHTFIPGVSFINVILAFSLVTYMYRRTSLYARDRDSKNRLPYNEFAYKKT